jgi:hypothetical protein
MNAHRIGKRGLACLTLAAAFCWQPNAFADGYLVEKKAARRHHRYIPVEPVEVVPPCRFEKRTFKAVGDDNNDFDENFGCSNAIAIAAMAARKRDLHVGRGTRLSDGERGARVVERYRTGGGQSDPTREAKPTPVE